MKTTTSLIRRETVKPRATDVCSEILIFAQKPKFYHWQQILLIIFLDVMAHFIHFHNIAARYTSLNNQFV